MTIRGWTLIVSLVFFFSISSLAQQSAFFQEVFTQARAGARVATDNSVYHQIAWTTSGRPGACYVALDYSADGMVWHLGQVIPIRDCTKSGSSPIAHATPRFVRMNVATLSSSGALRATYSGYQSNPGPTGTVTSVFGRTGDVLAHDGDYNVSQITGAAPLYNPNFQGSPTAPTPEPSDNSNRIATTAWVTAHCAACQNGGGAGGAVTSVFGRTGAIVAQANDYSVSQVTGAAPLDSPAFLGSPTGPTAAPGTNTTQLATTAFVLANQGGGPGGGLSGSGTANTLSKFTAATALGDSLLTDDGTTLHYTGTGGIVAPSVNVTGGAFKLESVVGTLPNPPAAGNNGLVSGPDGWYVSNNGAPYVGPIGVGGGTSGPPTSLNFSGTTLSLGTAPTTGQFLTFNGTSIVGAAAPGGTTGVETFNNRNGAVYPAVGDYTVGMVDGAAPLQSPAFQGFPTAPTPLPTSNDNSIATTEWVKANAAGGGGTPQPVLPIDRTYERCQNGTGGATSTNSFTGLTIKQGDTVVVMLHVAVTGSYTITFNDGMGSYGTVNTYIQRGSTISSSTHALRMYSTEASAAQPVDRVRITIDANTGSTFYACLAVYENVHSIGNAAQTNQGGGAGTSVSITMTLATVGSHMVSMLTSTGGSTMTCCTSGTRLTGTAANALCGNVSTDANQQMVCTASIATSSARLSAGMVLVPGIAQPTPSEFPKVVKFLPVSFTSSSQASSTVLCSAADCPEGFYRLTASIIVTTPCTTGGSIMPRVIYTDEDQARDGTLFESPLPLVANATESRINSFSTIGGSAQINYRTDVIACTTGGPAAGHLRFILERLY